jgi:hypothetical protein
MNMRKIINILVENTISQKQMTKVYHATLKKHVPKIMKDGLLPKIGARSKSAGEKAKAIYVFPDWTSMIDGITNWLGDEIPYAMSILELTIPSDWMTHDNLRWEATISQIVPPDHIRVIVDDIDEWAGDHPDGDGAINFG